MGKTKAELQAEVDAAEEFKRHVAKVALAAIIRNSMCEIGIKTLHKAGLGSYLPILYWAEWRDPVYSWKTRRDWNKLIPIQRTVAGAKRRLRDGSSTQYERRIVKLNPVDMSTEVIAKYGEYEAVS